MRKAKEVKVINRWRASEFDGEIPIGGDDEEMLGTAMKMANGVGQLQGIVEDSMPIVKSTLNNARAVNTSPTTPYFSGSKIPV